MEIIEEHIQTFQEANFLVQALSEKVQVENDTLIEPKHKSLKTAVLFYVTP